MFEYIEIPWKHKTGNHEVYAKDLKGTKQNKKKNSNNNKQKKNPDKEF